MAIQVAETNGRKVLAVRVSGKLAHGDYEHFVPKFKRSLTQHGKLRVLFEMTNFQGWKAGALWDDIILDLKHFSDVESLAIVGDKKWEKGMSLFCKPFTTAKIRYFHVAKEAEAEGWLGDDGEN